MKILLSVLSCLFGILLFLFFPPIHPVPETYANTTAKGIVQGEIIVCFYSSDIDLTP
jgi:hypothetical protein